VFVGIVKIEMIISDAQSLKFKRQGVRKIKDRIRSRFNCAISEVGHQDKWQKTTLGVSVVSSDKVMATAMIRKIVEGIDQMHLGRLIDEDVEILSF